MIMFSKELRFLIFLIANIFKVPKTDKIINEENNGKLYLKHLEMRKCDFFPSLMFYLANSPGNIEYFREIIKQFDLSYSQKEEMICVYDLSDLYK